MLTILLGFLFGFVFMSIICYASGLKLKYSIIPGIPLGIFISLLALAPALHPPISYIRPILAPGEHRIQAINDTSVSHREAYLLSGNIQEQAVYMCYIKIKYEDYSNVYEQIIFPAYCSVIIEEEISQPYVNVATEIIPANLWRLKSFESVKKYEFHVPPNSIKQMVNLDLEK